MTEAMTAAEAAPALKDRRKQLAYFEAALFASLAALAVLRYRNVFAGWSDFIVPALGAAIAGAAVAVVGSRNLSRSRTYALSLLFGVLFIIYSVLVSELTANIFPGPAAFRALFDGVFSGFGSILGDSLPVREAQPAQVFVTALSWIAGFTAADLSLRGRLVALPAVPGIALLALSLPLTAPLGGPGALYTVGFVALCFVAILVRATPEFSKHRRVAAVELHSRAVLSSRLTLGLPLIAVLAVLCPVIVLGAFSRDPFDPRELRDDTVDQRRLIDPMAEYRAIVSRVPAQSLFRVTFDGTSPLDVGRMPVLTLDGYDGIRWFSTGRFSGSGISSSVEDADSAGEPIKAKVFVDRLPNQFLPTVGSVTNIDLKTARVDARTGDILNVAPLDGAGYEIEARFQRPNDAVLRDAQPAVDSEAAFATRLAPGDFATRVGELTRRVIADADTAGAKVARIDEYLRSTYGFDSRAPSGSSYGALDRFLNDRLQGTPEQFASSFAVMARAANIPARLVLGYRLAEQRDGVDVALNDISTANYHVWVEVKYAGLGWVTYDPTPKGGDLRQPVDPTGGGAAGSTGGSVAGQQPSESAPSEAEPPQNETARGYLQLAARVAVGLALLVLAAAVLGLVVVAAKGARRRRRRSGSPADQITGAWDEVLDRLLEVGMSVPPSLTHRQVIQAAAARFGTDTVLPMRAMEADLTRAVFGPVEPTSEMADSAWQRAIEFEENVAMSIGKRRALLARLSLQPFLASRADDEATTPAAAPKPDDAIAPERVLVDAGR